MKEPVNRTLLLFDIERYSDRDDVEQAYLRRMLYGIADSVLEDAGVEKTQRLRADRGDSVMELIDANASVTSLLRALLIQTPAQLRAVNRMASSSAQIRLRSVLASGYVAVDDRDGWVGADLNHACRLLDAQVLRQALSDSEDDFALCVSNSVHSGIVRHGHLGIPPQDFHAVTVESKNGPLAAWLYEPRARAATVPGSSGGLHGINDRARVDGATNQGRWESAEGGGAPAGATFPVFNFSGGSVSFGGGIVGGDQHGVSGGQVVGDVHLGGGQNQRRGEEA